MPRPNRLRSIEGEANLARRIQRERKRLGWSYETLAEKLTKAGCPIQGSAIYKIEKSDPPRRITVDELVALAEVFEVSVENLLTPVEVLRTERAREVVKQIEVAERGAIEAIGAMVNAWVEYFELAAYDRDLREYVDGHVTPAQLAKDSVEAMPPLFDAWIEVDGEHVSIDIDQSPLRDGLEALFLGIIQTSGQIEVAVIEENKKRGIGSSPVGDQDEEN